jgi:hypothetical protein
MRTAPHTVSATRATEIGTVGLVVSVALFVAGITFGEGAWAAGGSAVVGTLTLLAGAGALLVALGGVLYLADVASVVVLARVSGRSARR